MTTAHVEKFAELLGKDPALLAKLGLEKVNADAAASAASAAAFITNAVKEAKALGLEFTVDEAMAYLTAEAKAAARGELSDSQLEAVAGGKTKEQKDLYQGIAIVLGFAVVRAVIPNSYDGIPLYLK